MVGAFKNTPQGGNQTSSHQESSTSKISNIYTIYVEDVNVQIRAKNSYDKEPQSKEPVSSENQSLQILAMEITLRPLKLTLKRETHNPNVRSSQNYNIVEDLVEAAYAMSTLEVLQSFLMQRKSFLVVIGSRDSSYYNIISFDIDNHKPFFPITSPYRFK